MSLLLFFQLGFLNVSAEESINDHWAEQNLVRALELGWIQGYEDGTIRPDDKIINGEFITIVERILDQDIDVENYESQYEDIKDVGWAYEYLKSAENLEILQIAFPKSQLQANRPITRGEAVTILVRAFEEIPVKPEYDDLEFVES